MNRKPDPTLQVQYLTGIVIIPMIDSAPVLIFKDFGAPFYMSSPDSTDGPIYDFRIHWQGKDYIHELPTEMPDEVIKYIEEMIQSGRPTYTELSLYPEDIIEAPIDYLAEPNKITIKDDSIARHITGYLIELGLVQEMRGAVRTELEKERDRFIIKMWEDLGRRRPFPISIIKNAWEKHVNEALFPDDADKAEAACCHENTVRHTLKRYIEGQFYEKYPDFYLKDFYS